MWNNTWIERKRRKDKHEEALASWNRYQSELDKNFEERSRRIDSKHDKKIALLLKNQELSLDRVKDPVDVPLVEELYKHFIGFDLVPVYPMLAPACRIHYLDHEYDKELKEARMVMKHEDAAARSRMIRRYSPQDMADKMTREIILDLSRNAGTVMRKKFEESEHFIYCKIIAMSSILHRKSFSTPNWFVTGPDIAHKLDLKPESSLSLTKINNYWGRYKVVIDPLFPKNEILVGCNDELLKGYSYNPYIPLTGCETRYITRFSKKLLSNKPYGLIKLEFE